MHHALAAVKFRQWTEEKRPEGCSEEIYRECHSRLGGGPGRVIQLGVTLYVDARKATAHMFKSAWIVVRAGAIMVETMMRLKPEAERESVTAHFRFSGQSLGLSAS